MSRLCARLSFSLLLGTLLSELAFSFSFSSSSSFHFCPNRRPSLPHSSPSMRPLPPLFSQAEILNIPCEDECQMKSYPNMPER